MFFNIVPNRLSVFKSPHKDFMIVTKITENKDNIIIKRNISYFDHKKQKYIQRTELQQFNCNDYETIDYEEDPYCNELKQYTKMISDKSSKSSKTKSSKIKLANFTNSNFNN